MVTVQQGLREDGVEMSMARLCRFDMPRRSVYYRPTKATSHGGRLARHEQEHGAAHLPAEGRQVRKRAVGERPRIEAKIPAAERPTNAGRSICVASGEVETAGSSSPW